MVSSVPRSSAYAHSSCAAAIRSEVRILLRTWSRSRGVKTATNDMAIALTRSHVRINSESGARTGSQRPKGEVQRSATGCRRSSCRLSRPAARCRKNHDERIVFEFLVCERTLVVNLRVAMRSLASITFLYRHKTIHGLRRRDRKRQERTREEVAFDAPQPAPRPLDASKNSLARLFRLRPFREQVVSTR